MPWLYAALIACACFAGHYLTPRAAAGRVPDALGGLVLEVAAALGLLVMFLVVPRGDVATTTPGIVWSAISGCFIVGGVTFLFLALRNGGPVSGTGTIALGGGVAIASLLAPLFFAEVFTLRRGIAIGLTAAATIVFATEK
jgi:uncharacterized membrane protein